MKLLSNYKKGWFGPILGLSVAAHALAFGLGSAFLPAPKYAVVSAPSSLEVVLLEEPKEKKKALAQIDKVLTAEESDVAVIQKEPEPVKEEVPEEKKIEKSITAPPKKGALPRQEAEYLENPAPVYPRLARQRGWEGLVVLRVFVTPDGRASDVAILKSSGHRVLDNAAVTAVQTWKFKPASLAGRTFGSRIEIPVRFVLTD